MEDNILEMFLEDTREHLADIETDLLDIEEAGPDFDLELVNKVFRTAHSIKGSAGFLALDNVRDLSHKIENVLDMIRSREIIPASDVVNVILRAFDKLQELVDNIEQSESIDISEHVEALTHLVTSHLPDEEKSSVTSTTRLHLPDGKPIFAISEHDLKQARKGGNYIYLVEYDLIHDVHKKDNTPLDLMKSLERSGLILDCKTDIGAVGDLEGELSNRIPFFVLYATILEPDLCRAIFQVDHQYIHHIEDAPAVAAEPEKVAPRKAVEKADLEDLERQLDEAMSRQPQRPASVSPTKPHASLTEVLKNKPLGKSAGEAAASPSEDYSEQGEGYILNGRGESGTLTFTGNATIERGADLRKALLLALERFTELTLDLEQIEEADLAFLQLLFATHRSAAERNIDLTIKADAAAPLLDVAKRVGFGHKVEDGFQAIFTF